MPGNRHNVGCKVVLLVYGLSWLPRGMERFARKYTTKVPMTLRLRRSLHVDVHPAYKPAVALFLAGFCHVRLREGSGLLVEDAAALVDEVHLFVLSLSAVGYYPPLEVGLVGNGRLRFENPHVRGAIIRDVPEPVDVTGLRAFRILIQRLPAW